MPHGTAQGIAKRVLIAEDDPSIVTALKFLLDRAGFDVSVETDGEAALAAVLDACPDVMVLDAMLPSLDGYRLLQALRADARAAHLPVVMLTAKGTEEARNTALACGANVFITKPYANGEVVDAVKALASAQIRPA